MSGDTAPLQRFDARVAHELQYTATPKRAHSVGRVGVAPEIDARVRKVGGVCLGPSRVQKICPDLELDSLFIKVDFISFVTLHTKGILLEIGADFLHPTWAQPYAASLAHTRIDLWRHTETVERVCAYEGGRLPQVTCVLRSRRPCGPCGCVAF